MRRRTRVALPVLLLVGTAAVATGCSGPMLWESPRQSMLESMAIDATVRPDGTVAVEVRAGFVDETGGILPVPTPLLGETTELTVDGQPATGTDQFETTNVPVVGKDVTASYVLSGVTSEASDATLVELPVLAPPSDGSRQDPPVVVEGTVTLPDGASLVGEPLWVNGLHTTVTTEAPVVRFDGEAPMWTASELLIGISPGAVAGGAPTGMSFADRRAQAAAFTEDLEGTLDSQETEKRIAGIAVMVVSFVIAAYLGASFVWHNTAELRERRRRLAAGPAYLAEPPNDLAPDLVAVLVGEGRRLDQDAVAGTVLALVQRRVVGLDGYGMGRWVIRVPPGASGATDAEQLVLDALRAQAPEGEIVGPPLWAAEKPSWWRAYRHDVWKRAKQQRLVERRFRFLFVGPFLAGIIGCTWPFWLDQEQVWLVPVLTIAASLLFIVPLGGGFKLTDQGFDQLMLWLGLGRYIRDHSEVRRLDPSAIAVWGPYLAYAAVLGEAPQAAADLAPRGSRERGSGREARLVGS